MSCRPTQTGLRKFGWVWSSLSSWASTEEGHTVELKRRHGHAGMVIQIPEAHRIAWAWTFVSIVRGDYEQTLDGLIEIGFFPRNCQRDKVPCTKIGWLRMSGEGRLGLPGQVWEFRFLPSFPFSSLGKSQFRKFLGRRLEVPACGPEVSRECPRDCRRKRGCPTECPTGCLRGRRAPGTPCGFLVTPRDSCGRSGGGVVNPEVGRARWSFC